ncbi:MAG: hypothetical protein OXI53_09190 [Nitrospira sp.]|nr:hypothetical protein [Nitrospira sp.]
MLTKEDAYAVAKKFGSKVDNGTNHDRVKVYCEGHLVGSYGISRGTREKKFDYIARQIYLTLKQTKDFARCALTKDQVCDILRENGTIPRGQDYSSSPQ